MRKRRLGFLFFVIMFFVFSFLAGCELNVGGSSTTPEEKPAEHVHKFGNLIVEVEPTCTLEGLKAHYQCSECGKVFDDNKVETTLEALKIPALNHDFSSSWTIENNLHFHTCSRCGEHSDEAQHTLIHHELVNATHTENGVEAYFECEICHGLFIDEECNNKIDTPSVINAVGHDETLIFHAKKDATHEEKGYEAYYECSCGKLFSDEQGNNPIDEIIEIEALGHDETLIFHAKKDATCEEKGHEAYYECSCGKLFSDEEGKNPIEKIIEIEALGHQNLHFHEQINATCTEDGTEAYYECDVCHKLYSDEDCQNLIESPIVISALGHQNINHVVGECSQEEEKEGHVDYYYCADCKTVWADEDRTIVIGNLDNNLTNITIPYSVYKYLKGDDLSIPYYDVEKKVAFISPFEANKSIAYKIYGPKITDPDAKEVAFYLKNTSEYSAVARICNADGSTIFKTITLTKDLGWQKIVLSVEQFNSKAYLDNYGLLISTSMGADTDEGLLYLSQIEFINATADEIALADSKLENVGVIDDISNGEYIKSFIESKAIIEEVKEILGSSIPTNLQNRDKLIEYYTYFENNKILYNSEEKLFLIDYMSSSYISGFERIEQNGLTLCKVKVTSDTSTILCKVPDFENSVKAQPYMIFRAYNPTDNKAVLNIYDATDVNVVIYSVNVYAKSWETIIIDTSLFTAAKGMFIRFTADGENSVKGDWLFTSFMHYSGLRRIIYGQGDAHTMTIYKANWAEAQRGAIDERSGFAANLVGPNTDSTAIVSLSRVDASLYDHIEFYIYNNTEYDLTIKTHMDGNNTYFNFEQTIEKGKWIKLEISVEIWNESYSRSTRYFELYPLNQGDSVKGMVYFSYFYGVLK